MDFLSILSVIVLVLIIIGAIAKKIYNRHEKNRVNGIIEEYIRERDIICAKNKDKDFVDAKHKITEEIIQWITSTVNLHKNRDLEFTINGFSQIKCDARDGEYGHAFISEKIFESKCWEEFYQSMESLKEKTFEKIGQRCLNRHCIRNREITALAKLHHKEEDYDFFGGYAVTCDVRYCTGEVLDAIKESVMQQFRYEEHFTCKFGKIQYYA